MRAPLAGAGLERHGRARGQAARPADDPALGIRKIRYGLGARRAERGCGCHLIPQSARLRQLS